MRENKWNKFKWIYKNNLLFFNIFFIFLNFSFSLFFLSTFFPQIFQKSNITRLKMQVILKYYIKQNYIYNCSLPIS